MTTQLDPPTPGNGATRLLAYYKDKGMSPEMAQCLVDDPRVQHPATPMPPAHTPELKIDSPDDDVGGIEHAPKSHEEMSAMAANIVANPNRFMPVSVMMARSVSALLERIADLEEDVERLRPKAVFVVEKIFETPYLGGRRLVVETESRGGLNFEVDDEDATDYMCVDLTPEQTGGLAGALAKWACLDGGVEWRSIDDPPGDGRQVIFIDKDDHDLISSGHFGPRHGCPVWGFGASKPTHWAPLPKPPVVK